MRDHDQELQDLNVIVVGVSFDGIEANKRFAEKQSFPYPLLSDSDRQVGVAYGAAKSDEAGMAARISYVIDETGKVLFAYSKVSPKSHADQIIADIQAATAG